MSSIASPSIPLRAEHATSSRTVWLLEQEARALLTRLDRVQPFALQQTMVPAAALLPKAHAGIDRYLIRGRRSLRKQVLAFLRWISGEGRRAVPTEVQRRFTTLKLHFNKELSQLDLFAEAIGQRSEHGVGVWLAGLDVAAQDALVLDPPYYAIPPVVCYLHRGMGGAIRRAMTRLPGGGSNPVALVRIPRERMIGYGVASSLCHECGHQAAALLGLVESMRSALRALLPSLPAPRRAVWELFGRWLSEIVADVFAIGKVGIASTLGLIGIVSLPRWFVFHADPQDPHPFPWIRVLLSCQVGDALYPHPQWRQLAATWTSAYPPTDMPADRRPFLDAIVAELGGFTRFLLDHRPASLRGQTLGRVLHMAERSPENLVGLHAAWSAEPGKMFTAPPTLVFAVFGRARIAGRLTPEQEDKALGQLLTHWALHSTLDLMDSSRTQWSPTNPRPEAVRAAPKGGTGISSFSRARRGGKR